MMIRLGEQYWCSKYVGFLVNNVVDLEANSDMANLLAC